MPVQPSDVIPVASQAEQIATICRNQLQGIAHEIEDEIRRANELQDMLGQGASSYPSSQPDINSMGGLITPRPASTGGRHVAFMLTGYSSNMCALIGKPSEVLDRRVRFEVPGQGASNVPTAGV